MYVLLALICALDPTTERGHKCTTQIIEQRFETKHECIVEKNRLMFYELPSREEKMVMGDCIYQPTKHVF
jgi:hypothetical protein